MLESNWGLGALIEGIDLRIPWTAKPAAAGLQIQYNETLPPSFRWVGGLKRTSGTAFKFGEISARMQFDSGLKFGLGAAYGIFTFDSLRIVFPFPTGHLSYLF